MNSLTENREPTSASPHSDEIDLFELIADLWKEKWIIISTTLIAGVIAVAYALLATPIYQSQAEVLPPYVSQITALNKGAFHANNKEDDEVKNVFERFSREDVYDFYLKALESKEYKSYFVNTLNTNKTLIDSVVGDQSIRVPSIKKVNNERYQITVTHSNPQMAQQLVNEYAILAGEWAKTRVIADRKAEVDSILDNIELELEMYQKQIDLAQKAEIKELKEGLYIAEKLGIESPMTPEGKATKEGAAYVDQNLLYMRGSKALTAQIEVLERRGIDVLLLPELRELTVKHEFFKSIEFDEDKISLYNLDAPAELPEKPIKPKKKLVVLIGGLVGFMLGGMIALVRIAMRNRKQAGLN